MTYTVILNCCTRCLNWEAALSIYNQISDMEIKNDLRLLSIVHECLVKCDQRQKAQEFLNLMKVQVGDELPKFTIAVLKAQADADADKLITPE